MRVPIVAGNWKMYKTPVEAAAFARALIPALSSLNGAERVVCPPFVDIPGVCDVLKGTPIKVGAQNVHWETQGAFTSSVAAPMLQGLVEYVIVGHSEARQYLCETDEMINKITWENACRFFRFDPFAHRARSESTVGALRALNPEVDISTTSRHDYRERYEARTGS